MTYKIGTRVRKVADFPKIQGVKLLPLGSVGVVVGHQSIPRGTVTDWGVFSNDSDCIVDYQGYGLRSAHSSMLEPIIDLGLVAGQPGVCTELDLLLAAERAES